MKRRVGTGFTIVELLIVIVVIAILAAITIVAFNGIQKRAANAPAQAALNAAAKKMEIAKVQDGTYPDVLPDDVSAPTGYMLSLSRNTDSFCINAEPLNQAPEARWSYEPVKGLKSGTCAGGVIENSEKGASPNLVNDTGFTSLNTGSSDPWALALSGAGLIPVTNRAGTTGDPYPERPVLVVTNSFVRSGVSFAYVRGPVSETAIVGGASYTLTYYIRVGSGTYASNVAYFGVMSGSATNASFQYVGNATVPNGTWRKVTRTVNATQNGVANTFLYLGLTASEFNANTFTIEFQGFEIRAN